MLEFSKKRGLKFLVEEENLNNFKATVDRYLLWKKVKGYYKL